VIPLQSLANDHPKKLDMLAPLVAHEMAHIWQLNTARSGAGEKDPWIFRRRSAVRKSTHACAIANPLLSSREQ
jgi:hypothetical protein